MPFFIAAMMIREFFRLVIPHFETNDVAVQLDQGQTYTKEQLNDLENYQIICYVEDLEPREEWDGIVKVRDFCWLGFGLFTKQLSDVRPFVNPWRDRK